MSDNILPKNPPNFNPIAQNVIRSLLDGESPNGITPESCQPYTEIVEAMYEAHAQGGTQAVRTVFNALANHNPQLIQLVSSSPVLSKTSWTGDEILDAEFPEPSWAIPDLIPSGLVYLAGRPKLGKSWLALQAGIAAGCGGHFLGHQVPKGRVLYLALEDNGRRIQDRAQKQKMPRGTDIRFELKWESLAAKGAADLVLAINQYAYTFVVIDTLSRALGRLDQNDQSEMNVSIGALQQLAIERDITIMPVDHHRKSASSVGDVIDDIMGATSKAAVTDAAIGLYRGRGQKDATLKLTGRDVDEKELVVKWDTELFCWQLVGDAGQVQQDTLQHGIMMAIRDNFGDSATCSDIAKFLDRNRGNVHKELSELVNAGILRRGKKRGREIPYEIVYGEGGYFG